jgi:hypothetical protein
MLLTKTGRLQPQPAPARKEMLLTKTGRLQPQPALKNSYDIMILSDQNSLEWGKLSGRLAKSMSAWQPDFNRYTVFTP